MLFIGQTKYLYTVQFSLKFPPGVEGSMFWTVLDVAPVVSETVIVAQLLVFLTFVPGESPLLRYIDLEFNTIIIIFSES